MATPLTPTVTGYTTDTGTPGDNITADRTLTFTGTGTPGASLEMIDLGGLGTLGFISAIPASGNWTITVGDGGNYPSGSDGILVDGTYDIRFGSRDGGDASALSSSFVVTVDGADLSAIDLTAGSDTGSSSSDNYTADSTPTIEFTAGAGDTLEIDWDDGNGFQAVGTGTGGSQTFTNPNAYPTGGAPEDKTVQVRSTKEGVSTVEEVTFTYDHQTVPASGGVVETGSGADYTNDSTPTIAGVGEAGATIEIKLGSGVSPTVASTTVDSAGNWEVSLPSLSDGTYPLTIRSEDQAGNSYQISGSSFTVDTSAPATPMLNATVSQDTGSSSIDRITSDTNLVLSGTTEANTIVNVYIDGSLTSSDSTTSSGFWAVSTGVLAEGAHTIRVEAVDLAGNTSSQSSALNVTIDTVAPTAPTITGFSDDTGTTGDGITGDTTPTLTGTAEANASVEILRGGSVVDTVTADGSGDWSFTSAALGAGDYDFIARSTDVAGNSSSSATLSIEVITAVTATPVITGISTDSGTSGTDLLTNDTTLLINGTATADAVVEVYLGGSSIGTATADGSGDWSFDYTGTTLAEGSHAFTATAIAPGENASAASAALNVTIDTTGPAAPTIDLDAASDSGSSDTDNVTSDATPTLSGTAEANASVEIFDGTTSLGTVTADGSGEWSFTAGTLSDGAKVLTAVATDAAGNASAASAALNVTIDTTGPAAPTIDLDAASDSGSSDTDNVTSDATPTLSGTAEANASVEIFDGTTSLGTVTADGSGEWSFTAGTLSDGAKVLTAVATDAAGNASAASAALNVTIDTVAPTAPTISGFSDDTGTTGDGITGDTTPTLTGTAEANASVEILRGGSVVDTVTADGSGDWSFTSAALGAGDYDFIARSTDVAGNSSSSATLSIEVITAVTVTPVITGISTDSGTSGTDLLTNDTTLLINGTATADAVVEVYLGGSSIGTATADGSGDWSFDYTGTTLAEGGHAFTATAIAPGANASAASSALNVTVDTTGPAAPTIDLDAASDSGSSDTDNVTSDATPTLSGTAEANASVEIFDGTTSLGTVTADGSGEWSFTAGTLSDGAKVLTAVATDAAGNASAASAALNVTIDTTGPAAPTIDLDAASDSGSSDTDNVTSDATPTLSGTAEANASVEIFDGTTSLGTVTADGSGEWSFTAGTLSDGAKVLTAVATDAAGNASAASTALNVTIDTTGPDDLTLDTDTVAENSAAGTLVGTVQLSEAATLVLTDDADGRFVLDGAELKVASGAVLDYEDETSRDVTVQATDVAGNVTSTVLTVQLSDVTETFGGGVGADTIYGDAGDNNIMAGDGDDFIFGGAGDDSIDGGTGNDSMEGGTGNDVMVDAQGNDTMDGGEGDDTLYMLNGSNVGRGGDGDDILIGGFGSDTLDGGAGNDIIRADVSSSNGGNDVLRGGAGDDLLEGGLGADDFIFATNDGNDEIGTLNIDVTNRGASSTTGSDFRSGVDQIFLEGFGYLNAAEAFTHVSDVGGVATFDDQGTTITFAGLTAADLSVDDFFLI